MKRTVVLFVTMVLCISFAFSQNLENRKGERFLPEGGDWALSIDATPFLNYMGNMFSQAGNTAPDFNYLSNNQAIIGKLFKDDATAYRAGIRLGFGTNKVTTPVPSNTSPDQYVDDVVTTSANNIAISAGLEMRRGKTRLQGYYGAECGIGLSGGKIKNSYGNSMTEWSDPRVLEDKQGSKFQFGIRGFIGAEYFLVPKICLGGEFGWGLGLNVEGQGETETEYYDGSNVVTKKVKTAKSSSFGFDTDNLSSVFGNVASVRITFHF